VLARVRVTCCFVVAMAVGIAAGVATGEQGTSNPGLPKLEQPGVGAALVGVGAALFVGLAMRIGYVLHRRRNPDATYRTRYRRGLTTKQYLRQLIITALICVALCCLGLLFRYQYG